MHKIPPSYHLRFLHHLIFVCWFCLLPFYLKICLDFEDCVPLTLRLHRLFSPQVLFWLSFVLGGFHARITMWQRFLLINQYLKKTKKNTVEYWKWKVADSGVHFFALLRSNILHLYSILSLDRIWGFCNGTEIKSHSIKQHNKQYKQNNYLTILKRESKEISGLDIYKRKICFE